MVTTFLSQSQTLNYSLVCCYAQPCIVSNTLLKCSAGPWLALLAEFALCFCCGTSSPGISF